MVADEVTHRILTSEEAEEFLKRLKKSGALLPGNETPESFDGVIEMPDTALAKDKFLHCTGSTDVTTLERDEAGEIISENLPDDCGVVQKLVYRQKQIELAEVKSIIIDKNGKILKLDEPTFDE